MYIFIIKYNTVGKKFNDTINKHMNRRINNFLYDPLIYKKKFFIINIKNLKKNIIKYKQKKTNIYIYV